MSMVCLLMSGVILEHQDDWMPVIELDEDGLWVCHNCHAKLILPTVGKEAGELTEELDALVGESAGAICHTLNLPYELPYQTIIDAASKIAYDEDRSMSAWASALQWLPRSARITIRAFGTSVRIRKKRPIAIRREHGGMSTNKRWDAPARASHPGREGSHTGSP
jgi:hypothetical protein